MKTIGSSLVQSSKAFHGAAFVFATAEQTAAGLAMAVCVSTQGAAKKQLAAFLAVPGASGVNVKQTDTGKFIVSALA